MNQIEFIQRQLDGLAHRLDHIEARERLSVAARYTTNIAQAVANNSATIIDFEDAVYDTRSAVTTGAAWKFTAPVGGYYQVNAAVMLGGSTGWLATEAARLLVYVGGVAYCRLFYRDDIASASSVKVQLHGSDVIYLAAAAYCDIRVMQTSGGSINLSVGDSLTNYVSIVKV